MKMTKIICERSSYDSMTRTITVDIIHNFKESLQSNKDEIKFELGYDGNDFPGRDIELGVDVSLSFNQEEKIEVLPDTGAYTENEEAFIIVSIQIDKSLLPEHWDELYFLVIDVVRHELEHITQIDHYKKAGKPGQTEEEEVMRYLVSQGMVPEYTYLLIPTEIDANLQGLRMKAKKMRTSLKSQMHDYFNILGMTDEQKEEVLKVWRKRAKEIGFNHTF